MDLSGYRNVGSSLLLQFWLCNLEARKKYCSQIGNFSDIERETSISINRGVDLGKTALYIAAEDDSLVSHSSVPLPVEAFIQRLDDLSMGYCSHYNSRFKSSPQTFLDSLDKYLYVRKVSECKACFTYVQFLFCACYFIFILFQLSICLYLEKVPYLLDQMENFP